MQQHGSKLCSRRHTLDFGVKRSKHFFSEINHVEDQNNENGVYSTLKVQMSKIHPTRSLGLSKRTFSFSKLKVVSISN